MKERRRTKLVANSVVSLGFLGLAMLARVRASAFAAALVDVPIAADKKR